MYPPRPIISLTSIQLSESKESAIIRHTLDLDARGFPPAQDMMRDMADKLLAERHGGTVGKN